MAVFKCKMCGGDLNVAEGMKIVECEYCGTTQTVPNADSEKKTTLFNRANRLRLNNEFDKAAALYEQIAAEFPEEAEAYWGLCLCNWGIEYVDDPATGEKKPTCHRASFESLLKDENYALAMEYADVSAQRVYRREAQEIDRINNEILAISRSEKPYDVFICYKETDDAGGRTPDSVMAQDIYDALTAKGCKVFFARITLEDKLGRQYEPYIFAALNSAKIMLCVGTKYEYFHAVWVKNEWRRFLRLAAKDKTKLLIPCFRDMDPYDLPDEFRPLQAQDMAKLGAMQDLVRGVQKILPKNAPVQSAVPTQPAAGAAATTDSLLKRAVLFLEDGDWSSADEYAERVLDIDPENGEAYLAKAMVELQVKTRGELNSAFGFEENANTRKAIRFGSDALKKEIEGYIEILRTAEQTRGKAEAAWVAVEKSAQPRHRKAEKTRNTAAEAMAKREADRVIASIRAALAVANGETPEKRLARTNKRIAEMESLCADFNSVQANLFLHKDTLQQLQAQKRYLKNQRENLGLFSGGERQRIDVNLAQLTTQIKSEQAEVKTLTNRLCGCETRQQAEQELSRAQGIAELIRKERALAVLSSEQIKDLMKQNELIGEFVLAKAPDLQLYIDLWNGRETVRFGHYPQAANGESAPIEWRVLKHEKDRALLLSEYALTCQPFHAEWTSVQWESCSLRRWLNSFFINRAFNEEEQCILQQATVTADHNPPYGTSPGNNSWDKVFLLSATEADTYFYTNEARWCEATDYAKKQGTYSSNDHTARTKATCKWWLRSPGEKSINAACVDRDGSISTYGNSVNFSLCGVRPALWVDVDI